jgi:ubiquinone/menaquinone biosynthesis C-methylase UbiE
MKNSYLDKARKVYAENNNVTEFLKNELQKDYNTDEIIEIAYDLQAGSYIKNTNLNRINKDLYANELAEFLKPYLTHQSSLLDVGTGELTTLSLLLNRINESLSNIFAFDISWSRLYKGLSFFQQNCNKKNIKLRSFVADIQFIPLPSKSIDIVTSSHALEPNGNNLENLLKEIFRVTKNKCILFEPSYELNCNEGKRRMDKLGYIKNIEGVVSNLGGKVIEIKLLKNIGNILNPTACFIIEPSQKSSLLQKKEIKFTVPGTDMNLVKEDYFYKSIDTGLVFPILKNIPILKKKYGILATALF